jgi:superfamily II DNA or RNA helicase
MVSARLFEAVRAGSGPSVWSRGGELARAGAVRSEPSAEGEIALRIVVAGQRVAPEVVLHPDELAWECDCGSRDDPCAHVAAAVIALRRGLVGAPEARVGYRLRREGGGLSFERVVAGERGEEPLRGTLAAIAAGRVAGPRLAATAADDAVERALGAQRAGRLPRGVLQRVVALLADCPDVRLDGEPVHASREPCALRARVADSGSGFVVRLERDPPVSEELGDGVVRCGGELRVLGPSGLLGSELEAYARGRSFAPEEAAKLAAEVIPALARRIPVAVDTERLPRAEREAPRLAVETRRDGDALAAMATLVYGDPPRARVDAGRLVALRGALPARDLAAEERLLSHLRATLGLEPGVRVRLEPGEAIAFAAKLERFRGRVLGDAHHAFFLAPALAPRFEGGSDQLALEFVAGIGPGAAHVSAERAIAAWRAGASLVPLSSGGFAPLPREWLERHGALVADLLAARDAAGERLAAAALPDLGRLCEALGVPAPPGLAALRPLLADFAGVPRAELPADLRAELRDYQRAGVDGLRFLGGLGLGALLADDMGLGKTLQALCALRGRALVVAPTSVLFGWAEETERFRPALRRCLFHGPARSLDPDADLTLTSYALLRLERERLGEVAWDTVVLDEAQAIKNPESQAAQAAFGLRAGVRIALTGTPVENHLGELWSLFHFLNPGLLGARSDFEARYARPIAEGDAEAAERLRARIRPFVLRRRKADVARELPARHELVVRVALGEEERALYEAVRAASVPEVVARLREGGSVLAALEALLRLRQACCHPALLPGREAETSSKVEALLERLETAVDDGHKCLVFSQWTALLDLVEPHLVRAGIAHARLDGSTRDRAGVVASFVDPAGPPVLLISLRAGGTGLNLAAADHVFLLEPWWNPAVEDQAADRAHRIGQTRPVLVHRLVARETVEEAMLALQAGKRALAGAAVEELSVDARAPSELDLLAVLGEG